MSTKSHRKYRLRGGDIVPGVTTILDSQLGWAKRVLMAWSRREALSGGDSEKILRDTGKIGTCAHLLCQGFLEGRDVDIADFSSNQIKCACFAFESFKSFWAVQDMACVRLEFPVISEEHRFGGTLDIVAKSGGKLILIDLKTSKGLYPEFICQVAAYGRAYESQEGQKIGGYHLLKLSTDGPGYEHHVISPEHISVAWEVFLHCRELYDLQRKLKGFN